MKQERYHYIDWIRIIAFGLLIILHCAVPFTSIPWEINNSVSSTWLTEVVFWLHQWRLPLLFFVSGIGIRISLGSRGLGGFYVERLKRLFIPLLFAMFFTIPLQPYFEFLQDGKIAPGYWDFYKRVWELQVYPDGPLTWSHMWFIVYLIAYIIILLPLLALSRLPFISRLLDKTGELTGRPLVMVLMLIPLIFIFYRLYLDYPQNGSLTEDWFAFTYFLLCTVYGFIIGRGQQFFDTARKLKWIFGSMALLTLAILAIGYWHPMPVLEKATSSYTFYAVLVPLHTWSMILFFCGMAKAFLNFPSPVLSYLNRAVYPYYIIHQTVIVAFGYYITGTGWPIWMKLPLLIGSSIAFIMLLYHVLIRKTRLMRFLFGMKN